MTPAQPPVEDPHRFILPIRVYYEDTDAAGVVYYANYLRFCERARTEWLRALGFEQQALMRDSGIAFVVRAVSAEYRLPARLDDTLTVISHIAETRGASLVFAPDILRGKDLSSNRASRSPASTHDGSAPARSLRRCGANCNTPTRHQPRIMTVTNGLSIVSLISQASAVVQFIMALLAALSLISWYWIYDPRGRTTPTMAKAPSLTSAMMPRH